MNLKSKPSLIGSDIGFHSKPISYNATEILFHEGDPGGDLYFIKRGYIEIFQVREGEEIHLTQLGPGDVIGTLTFLTRDRRFASARAKSSVELEFVKRTDIESMIRAIPSWLETVIKDFVLRIENMNRRYRESRHKIRSFEKKRHSRLELAVQIANGANVLAYANGFDDKRFNQDKTDLSLIVSKLAQILDKQNCELQLVLKIFNQLDIIQIERDKEREFINAKGLRELSLFAQFIKEMKKTQSEHGTLQPQDYETLLGLSKIARFMSFDPFDNVEMTMDRLQDCFAKIESSDIDLQTLSKAHVLKIIHFDQKQCPQIIQFVPSNITRHIQFDIAKNRFELYFDDEDFLTDQLTAASY